MLSKLLRINLVIIIIIENLKKNCSSITTFLCFFPLKHGAIHAYEFINFTGG